MIPASVSTWPLLDMIGKPRNLGRLRDLVFRLLRLHALLHDVNDSGKIVVEVLELLHRPRDRRPGLRVPEDERRVAVSLVTLSSTLIRFLADPPAAKSRRGCRRLNIRSPMWTTFAFSNTTIASPLVCPAPL